MKIKFTANISPQISKSLSRYKKLLSEMIEDESLSFYNYEINEYGTYIVTVMKEQGSYFIYWEAFSSMYLRYKPGAGLSVGYKFNNEEYIDFFISEPFRDNHVELMEENIALWSNDMKSFPKSHYVTRQKILKPFIHWSPQNPCLPDYMFLEISLRNEKDVIGIIRKFYNSDLNIKRVKRIVIFME